jgi:hypothetical protein
MRALPAQGAYSIDLKQYSKLTGYAWGGARAASLRVSTRAGLARSGPHLPRHLVSSALAAFVGAAGLAFGLTQILNLGKSAHDAPAVSADGEALPPSISAKST